MSKTIEEKVHLILEFMAVNWQYNATISAKNEAVRKQDFNAAAILRETEKETCERLMKFGSEIQTLLNSEPKAQASGATEANSSNADDQQKQNQ
jgi:hypothetical protein